MPEGRFRFRVFGRDHVWYDASCPGCELVDGKQYPRPHKEFGTGCTGLVHSETVTSGSAAPKTILVCDVCFANPK